MEVLSYWAGYLSESQPFNTLPTGINEIILAFLGPQTDSCVETTFINSNHTNDAELGQWLGALKASSPNIRLTLSFLDTPSMHWGDANFKPDVFVQSVFDLIAGWGLALSDIFYNIDLETGGPFVPGFLCLINALAKGLEQAGITGPQMSLVGYTGSSDEQTVITTAVASNCVYRVMTMDYYNPADSRIALAQLYTELVGDVSRVCVLGAAPEGNDAGTPIEVMQAVVAGVPGLGSLGIWPLPASTVAPSINAYVAQIVALAEAPSGSVKPSLQERVLVTKRQNGHAEQVAAFRLEKTPPAMQVVRLVEEADSTKVLPLQREDVAANEWPICVIS